MERPHTVSAERMECTIVGGNFASTARNPTTHETRKYVENIKEANIQNKMRLDKCDAYTAKETLGYRRGNTFQLQEGQQRERKT